MSVPLRHPLLIGKEWERVFEAEARRHFVVESVTKQRLPYDFLVNGFKVQCKASFRNDPARRAYVTITKGGTGSTLRYRPAELDVFAICWHGNVYLIPVHLCIDKKNHLQCKKRLNLDEFSEYQNAWGVFDGNGVVEMQKRLW